MDFAAYVLSLGLDIATITADQKVNLQAAWRATDRAQQLQTLRESRTPGPLQYGASNGGPDAAHVLEAGLLAHIGVGMPFIAGKYGEQTADAITRRENRVTGIQHVFRQFLASHGAHVPTGKFTDSDIVDVFRLSSGVGPSTGIQVSGILSNVANKSMLATFQETAVSWRRWAKTGSVDDFKSATRYRLTGSGSFQLIAPSGEIKHVGLTEASATAQANTYGALIGISRNEIINDDLSAFAQSPKVLSRMAAVKIEKLATEKLLENSGGTSTGFFSTAHANWDDGAVDSVLSLAGLDNAYAMFANQTDSNGDPVLMPPTLLLVPPALEPVIDY